MNKYGQDYDIDCPPRLRIILAVIGWSIIGAGFLIGTYKLAKAALVCQ